MLKAIYKKNFETMSVQILFSDEKENGRFVYNFMTGKGKFVPWGEVIHPEFIGTMRSGMLPQFLEACKNIEEF